MYSERSAVRAAFFPGARRDFFFEAFGFGLFFGAFFPGFPLFLLGRLTFSPFFVAFLLDFLLVRVFVAFFAAFFFFFAAILGLVLRAFDFAMISFSGRQSGPEQTIARASFCNGLPRLTGKELLP